MFAKIDYEPCIDICWDITTACNFKCPYCFNNREYKPSKPLMFSKRAIDIAAGMISRISSPVIVGILGGEPTLHPLLSYIICKLIDLPNVKKIKIVSNSHKDMSYIVQDPKVHLCLSYHPLEGNFYIDNLRLPRTTLYVLMVQSKLESVLEFYNKARMFGVSVIPEYIVTPSDDVKLIDSEIPDPLLYMHNDSKISFKKACGMSFKGETCYMSHYKIKADGSILLECANERIGTIYDCNIADKITIRPAVCCEDKCVDDFLLEMLKK